MINSWDYLTFCFLHTDYYSPGVGKTTLLNVLANRVSGRVDGQILYNGNPKEYAKQLLKHQAYVMQVECWCSP